MSKDYVSEAYSTHTFLWPFTFKGAMFAFDRDFPGKTPAKAWQPDDALHEGAGDRFLDAFMVAQYFNAQAREIFTGEMPGEGTGRQWQAFDGKVKAELRTGDAARRETAAPVCRRFLYDPDIVRNLRYFIHAKEGGDNPKDILYHLPIARVRLFLLDSCGVGVLSVEAYNTKYKSLADVKRINDFGRRIRLPFLPREGNCFILCAERLGILCDGDDRWVTDFRASAEDAASRAESGNAYREGMFDPAEFIAGLLCGKVGKGEEKPGSMKDTGIVPASDDRMFLVSLVKADEAENLAKEFDNLCRPRRPHLPQSRNAKAAFEKGRVSPLEHRGDALRLDETFAGVSDGRQQRHYRECAPPVSYRVHGYGGSGAGAAGKHRELRQ